MMDLQPKIVECGCLEACNNNDVMCEVRCGDRGCPKIKRIVGNGSHVKRGDLSCQSQVLERPGIEGKGHQLPPKTAFSFFLFFPVRPLTPVLPPSYTYFESRW